VSTTNTAIELRSVTKTFGSLTAVDRLDLAIPRGALYGFIGPNGAGKTTAIRMIMSILLPDSGELRVLGARSALEAKDRVGYLPEERGLYRKMKVAAYLTFIARLKGVAERGLKERVHSAIERIGLKGVENKRCEELSKGMSQKIQILAAIIHEPDLLILDEPFSGLDPVSTRLLKDLILAQHARGATVLFSTHVMPQAEEICDHVVMIHRGQKVLDDPVRTILRPHDSRALTFEPLDAHIDLSAVRALPEVERCVVADGRYEVALREGVDAAAAMGRVLGVVPAARIELKRRSLEDVFVSIVAGSASSSVAAGGKNVGVA
jgi:ABC-2 type transport system ATP-binding protein